MAIIVNHEERRREILRKSLRIFAESGYGEVTFQRIADCCGLARTALYKYFHHKNQIFDGAVTIATNELVGKYREILARPGTYHHKLEAVIAEVFKILFSQRDLLLVIVEYTLAVKRSGKSLRWVVTRHTRGLKAALCYLLLKGIRAGEFAPTMDVRATTEVLYAIIESTVLRLTLTDNAEMEKQMAIARQVLDDLPKMPGHTQTTGGKRQRANARGTDRMLAACRA
ncbi:MAG: TetR/AcrR family transcriptional regulator [Kiritimatiellia bacterium]